MLFPDDQLVLGRGRVYFEPFAPGTRTGQGERYVGNTTSFQITREVRRQVRKVSVGGKKYEDFGSIIEESHKVTFVTDNIDIDNVADFFGFKSGTDFLTTGFVSESFVARKGRFYQIGKQFSVVGVRHALVTTVKTGSVVRSASDWEADTLTGRLYIPPTSSIPDGATITVEWESRDQRVQQVVSSNAELWGALRFVSDNAEGQQKNVLLPCVRLFARGAIDLKGDQWQQLPFEADVSHLTPALQQVYFDFVDALPGKTADEKWLDANPIFAFRSLEDLLDEAVNVLWPIALTTQPAVYFYNSAEGSESPADGGMGLIGVFDLLVDGIKIYRGLNGPFVRPDIDAVTIAGYISELDNTQDYLLRNNGARFANADDDLVLSGDDIWSIGTYSVDSETVDPSEYDDESWLDLWVWDNDET